MKVTWQGVGDSSDKLIQDIITIISTWNSIVSNPNVEAII